MDTNHLNTDYFITFNITFTSHYFVTVRPIKRTGYFNDDWFVIGIKKLNGFYSTASTGAYNWLAVGY